MSVDLTRTDVDGLLRLYVTADARKTAAQYIDSHNRYRAETEEAEAAMQEISRELKSRCVQNAGVPANGGGGMRTGG